MTLAGDLRGKSAEVEGPRVESTDCLEIEHVEERGGWIEAGEKRVAEVTRQVSRAENSDLETRLGAEGASAATVVAAAGQLQEGETRWRW